MTRLYISGPMTGIPDFNYPAFHEAAKALRKAGYEVISPAELDDERGEYDESRYEEYLAGDLLAIDQCDGIATLPNWEQSRGARLEVAYAKAHGMKVMPVTYWILVYGAQENAAILLTTPPPNILKEAESLIHGDRQKDYGHPIDDFSRTAGMLKAQFGWEVEPIHIPQLMILLKISRIRQSPKKRDHWVDICGYAGTAELVIEKQGGWS